MVPGLLVAVVPAFFPFPLQRLRGFLDNFRNFQWFQGLKSGFFLTGAGYFSRWWFLHPAGLCLDWFPSGFRLVDILFIRTTI